MRLWSISPSYLDCQGLCGLWREALLGQKVLANQTTSYKNHPQLNRFKEQKDHLCLFISAYLWEIWQEGQNRNYNFIWQRIWTHQQNIPDWVYNTMTVTKGQLVYEWKHLQNKLWQRNREQFFKNLPFTKTNLRTDIKIPKYVEEGKTLADYYKPLEPHPLFKIIDGSVETWEKVKNVK